MIDAALILEGGGMRGVYTAGVLDCLMDADLYFQRVYGVSAGAGHGCSYLSHQRGRALRTVLDFRKDPRYAGLRSLARTGDYFGARMIYHEIPDTLLPFDYDAYAASGMELYAVLTDCATGLPVYRRVTDARREMEIVRASSSLPLLSKMVELDGVRYLDGGIADSIPLGRSIADGNHKNLVVLTQHRGYQKGPASMARISRRVYRDYPRLLESMETRHQRYNEALALVWLEEEQGDAFVIQPGKPVAIGRLEKNPAKLTALYQEGYDDAQARLPDLRRFLGNPSPASAG